MDEDREFEIQLPSRRNVRLKDYFPRVVLAFNNGRQWPEEFPELIEQAVKDAAFRQRLLSWMRNCMWVVRNHRTMRVETVIDSVRDYAATERLLELAGVHPLMLSLFCDFCLCECNCNGSCGVLDFDLADPESGFSRPCDHVKLRARELVEDAVYSESLILGRLLPDLDQQLLQTA